MIGQKEIQRIEALKMDELFDLGLLKYPSGLAIDVGAHVGSWTVKMAANYQKVMAFEPCKDSFEMLVQNTIPYRNVYCYNKAVMDRPCKVSVDLPSEKRTTLTARQVNYGGDIDAITIDSLHVTQCDLIKIDVEGAECLVLHGARSTLFRCRPFLIVEFGNLGRRFGKTDEDLIKMLKSMDYKQVWQDGVDRGFQYDR